MRIKNTKSDTKIQQNGIPQGSILSIILIAIKINIIENMPIDDQMSASLFVDEFQIGYKHSDLSIIGSKLQQFLIILET